MSLKSHFQVEPCPLKLWDEIASSDPTASFFQTPEWYRINSNYSADTVYPLLFKLKDETAVLPLIQKKKFFKTYHSPHGTYTGLLSETPLSQNFIDSITAYLNTKNIRIMINPFSHNIFLLTDKILMPTYTVDLKPLSVDKIWQNWKKGHRDNLRMAQKKGVTVKAGNSELDIDNYYAIYLSTVNRWKRKNFKIYSKQFLKELIRTCVPRNSAKFWLCEFEGTTIAGALVFYFNQHIVAWHSATDSKYFERYPNQLLFSHILKDAKEMDMETFDFNPSKDLEGVIKFKQGFGAVEQKAFYTWSYTPIYNLIQKLKG